MEKKSKPPISLLRRVLVLRLESAQTSTKNVFKTMRLPPSQQNDGEGGEWRHCPNENKTMCSVVGIALFLFLLCHLRLS